MRSDINNGGIPPVNIIALTPNRIMGRAVTKVVHRCQDAAEDQKLDLSDCQLMHVPDGVYHLMRNTIVLWCNLSSNVLRKIPSKFTVKFSNVTDLNLSNNQLNSLPDELCDLTDLQRLDISHNQYQTVPKVVYKIPRIEYVNAQKNFITEVDVERINAVPTLKEVDFRENPLNESSHDQLKNLTRITIHLSERRDMFAEMELDDLEPE